MSYNLITCLSNDIRNLRCSFNISSVHINIPVKTDDDMLLLLCDAVCICCCCCVYIQVFEVSECWRESVSGSSCGSARCVVISVWSETDCKLHTPATVDREQPQHTPESLTHRYTHAGTNTHTTTVERSAWRRTAFPSQVNSTHKLITGQTVSRMWFVHDCTLSLCVCVFVLFSVRTHVTVVQDWCTVRVSNWSSVFITCLDFSLYPSCSTAVHLPVTGHTTHIIIIITPDVTVNNNNTTYRF